MIKNHIQSKSDNLKLFLCGKDEHYEIGNSIIPKSQFNPDDYCHVEEIMDSYKNDPIINIMDENNIKYLYDGIGNKRNGYCLFCPETFKNNLSESEILKFKDYLCKKYPEVVVVGSDFHVVHDFIKLRPPASEKLKFLKKASIVYSVENEYLYLCGRERINYCFINQEENINQNWKRFFKNHIIKNI